ncbi:MAG: hypothetical protein HOW73_34300 [Polyangiaceae bacterium]|nr:hypothetical protein [Polyangiaceae bacterium]
MKNTGTRPLLWLASAALTVAGCGVEQGQYHVSGAINSTEGFVLESSSVIEVTGTNGIYDPGESDFYLDVSETAVTLKGASGGAFCKKGSFANVEDIPADDEGCSWANMRISDTEPNSAVVAQGDGYLVRDRDGLLVYRLLIVGTDYDTSGIATVYFDLEHAEVE